MNTILQKRIEEAASHYLLHEHKSPLNDALHQCNLKIEMRYHKDIEQAYIEGAVFALQNQWISVEEALPDYQKDVVVSDGLEYWMSWRTQETDAAHKDKNDFINHSTLEIKYWTSVPKLKGDEK